MSQLGKLRPGGTPTGWKAAEGRWWEAVREEEADGAASRGPVGRDSRRSPGSPSATGRPQAHRLLSEREREPLSTDCRAAWNPGTEPSLPLEGSGCPRPRGGLLGLGSKPALQTRALSGQAKNPESSPRATTNQLPHTVLGYFVQGSPHKIILLRPPDCCPAVAPGSRAVVRAWHPGS